MRFKSLSFIVMLLLHLPLLAQESDFPTLDALANLDTPAFDYADMVGRMSRMNPLHEPPASPPQYEIGDRDWFSLTFGADRVRERVHNGNACADETRPDLDST